MREHKVVLDAASFWHSCSSGQDSQSSKTWIKMSVAWADTCGMCWTASDSASVVARDTMLSGKRYKLINLSCSRPFKVCFGKPDQTLVWMIKEPAQTEVKGINERLKVYWFPRNCPLKSSCHRSHGSTVIFSATEGRKHDCLLGFNLQFNSINERLISELSVF